MVSEVLRLLRTNGEVLEYEAFLKERDYSGDCSIYDFLASRGWFDRVPIFLRARLFKNNGLKVSGKSVVTKQLRIEDFGRC